MKFLLILPLVFIFTIFVFSIGIIGDSYGMLNIKNDGTGGDCSTFGTWNPDTKTCTLTSNVNEEIDILSNWITLDGNNHSINGTSVHRSAAQVNSCIFLDGKTGVTITNLKILGGCTHAVTLYDSLNNVISNLQILGTTGGVGIHIFNSDDNKILNSIFTDVTAGMSISGLNNHIEGNKLTGKGYGGQGISVDGSNNIVKNNEISNFTKIGQSLYLGSGILLRGEKNQVIDNILKDNNYGITLKGAQQNQIESNIVSNNLFSGIFLGDAIYYVTDNVFLDNQISNNKIGIEANSKHVFANTFLQNTITSNSEIGVTLGRDLPNTVRTERNVFVNNNFIENTRQLSFGQGNTFYFDDERGGNYWDDYSSGCLDSNSDMICDEPYPFSRGTIGVVDNAVWVQQNGWEVLSSEIIETQPEPLLESKPETPIVQESKVPEWIKNNAKWWSEGQIDDSDFVSGIQHLIKENIITITNLPEQASETAEGVPDWVRNNAGWWADGLISDDDFVSGIKYLVEQGIIKV